MFLLLGKTTKKEKARANTRSIMTQLASKFSRTHNSLFFFVKKMCKASFLLMIFKVLKKNFYAKRSHNAYFLSYCSFKI